METVITYILGQITSFDRSILRGIYYTFNNGHLGGFLDRVMPKLTVLGDMGLIWIVVTLVLLIPKKTRRTGASMAVALVLCLIFGNGIIKNLVMRPRPFDMPGCLISRDALLIAVPTDYSFPSGHTLSGVAASTALFKDHTVLGFAAFVFALIIAFSRLYLQVHYPSDVLGGMLLGFLLGLWGSSIVKTVTDFWTSRKRKQAELAAAKK